MSKTETKDRDFRLSKVGGLTMSDTILTNEWTDATIKKPWKGRLVSIRFEDGSYGYAKWNGMYWVGQHDMRLTRTEKITHFYIFELFNRNQ